MHPLTRLATVESAHFAKSAISLELFLVSLMATYPWRLRRVLKQHSQLGIQAVALRSRAASGVLAETEAKGLLFAQIDPALLRVLCRSITIATAAGRRRARIPDFIAALALEQEQTLTALQESTGIELLAVFPPKTS